MKRGIQFLFLFFLAFSIQSLYAQNVDETIKNLSKQAASAYAQPVVSAYSSNLNSAWFDYSPSASILGLDLSLKVSASASFFKDDQKTFASSGSFRFTSGQVDDLLSNSGINSASPGYQSIKDEMLSKDFQVNFKGPTIVGSENEHLVITFPGATIQGENIAASSIDVDQVKGLLDNYSALPFGSIQLGLGTVYGTKALIRWFPEIDVTDLGKIKFYGWGFLHNASIWFGNGFPIDISLGVFSQHLEVGNVFESNATQYGVYFSKTFGSGVSFAPFVGVTGETATTTIKYDYSFDTPSGPSFQSLEFDLEGDNSASVIVGANFKLFILNFAVDYKLSKTNTASASIFFGF